MSPSNEVADGNKNAFYNNSDNNEGAEMAPQDDYINVKIYFYGTDKSLRTKVFPQELYFSLF